MATTALSINNFSDTIDHNELVIIDFWAKWCGPCRSFGPIFEEASKRHPDVIFAKVDTEDQQVLAGSLGIRSIPTVMIFRQGILLFSQPGLLPEAALDDLLKQARGLDMDKVRSEIEQAHAQHDHDHDHAHDDESSDEPTTVH